MKPDILNPHKLRGKKLRMYEQLVRSLGNVSKSSIAAQVGRKTHYDWLSADSVYKEAVEGIADITVDYAEAQLFKLISKCDKTAIIFFLKTKGRSRGYAEYMEVKGSINSKQEIINRFKEDYQQILDQRKENKE